MPVKLRLARHGRKKFAFYHIVAADGRAPRDGKFIEKLGVYNPNTNPATIELDFDKSLNWLLKGAQPTETVRAILSYRGLLMKKHLLEGVRKGAFSEEEAEKRFAAWMKEKEGKIQAKVDGLTKAEEDDINSRLEAETKVNETRAAEILKRRSELAEAADKAAAGIVAEDEEVAEEEVAEVEATAEAQATEAPAEEPKVAAEAPVDEAEKKEVKDEKVEEAKDEAKEEVKAEEKKEEAKDEVKAEEKVAEAPVAEEKKPEAAKVEEPKEKEGKEAEKDSKGKKTEEVKAEGKEADKQAEDKKD
jgi:small subunit ribosomal protein S16